MCGFCFECWVGFGVVDGVGDVVKFVGIGWLVGVVIKDFECGIWL